MDKLDDFKIDLLKKRKSQLTIKNYVSDISFFLTYLKDNNIDIHKITLIGLYFYRDYMLSQGKKITTINRHIVAINTYLKFLEINVELPQEKVQFQNFLDDVFTKEEFEKMIHITELCKDIRAKTLFLTLYLTGMRISECLSLTVDDVEKREIVVKGKGSKYRQVFISSKLRQAWKDYLVYRIKKSNKLFTGREGAISNVTAHNIVKKYTKLADIDKNIHCHTFRHGFGKEMSNKVDIDTVASLLGHVNINVTRIYTRKSRQELQNIIEQL